MVWLLAILAYLLGSLSFAVLLSRWFGTHCLLYTSDDADE